MILSFFKRDSLPDIYVDLGTVNTLVAVRNKGLIINEPSVIAYSVSRPGKKTVVAVGKEAQQKISQAPGNFFSSRPLKDGVIADLETTEALLHHFLTRPEVAKFMTKPRIVISIPFGVTEVEKKAVIEAGKAARAREVILVDEPMAAAIGAGLQVQEAKGNMLIDFGGGTTEVAIISLGGIVFCKSVRIGGHKIDSDIMEFLKRHKSIIINETVAERLKVELGAALPIQPPQTKKIQGRNATSGLSTEVEITSEDIFHAIEPSVNDLIKAIREALENTPPELLSDIMDSGIVLTGGGSLLRLLDKRIESEVKIHVRRSENPLTTIAVGGERLLNNQELLERVQIHGNPYARLAN